MSKLHSRWASISETKSSDSIIPSVHAPESLLHTTRTPLNFLHCRFDTCQKKSLHVSLKWFAHVKNCWRVQKKKLTKLCLLDSVPMVGQSQNPVVTVTESVALAVGPRTSGSSWTKSLLLLLLLLLCCRDCKSMNSAILVMPSAANATLFTINLKSRSWRAGVRSCHKPKHWEQTPNWTPAAPVANLQCFSNWMLIFIIYHIKIIWNFLPY